MNIIQKIRKNAGFTQDQIAKAVNVDRSTVAKWETNKAKPRVDTLIKLAALFECSVDELVKQ